MRQTPQRKQPDIYYPKNEQIRGTEVRLVGDNVEQGIYDLQSALELARLKDLDLVLINSKPVPPICRIADYGKLVYDEKRRRKELEKKNRESKVELKEIRFTPATGHGDLEHKAKKAIEFLKDGDKVKLSVKFKGRQMHHKDQGERLLLEFAVMVEDYGVAESMPEMQGRFMNMTLKPKQR